ncbi:hypothetical protein BDV40DRAFT_251195 [Aspergillus tamarii]|uniref:Uncharacterized protein n=1 Tax=Aspergillus tamarii TaxID=41984 RepID=A0A5N6VC91_ASPTM|nr:hypothetical protein BDV40DRAFT_251195 [Aspergillus tamarii]
MQELTMSLMRLEKCDVGMGRMDIISFLTGTVVYHTVKYRGLTINTRSRWMVLCILSRLVVFIVFLKSSLVVGLQPPLL